MADTTVAHIMQHTLHTHDTRTYLQPTPLGIQPLQTFQHVGPTALPGPRAEQPRPVHAGGADAALLPHGAGRPVQAAFGQVVLDEAEDVGRFYRQEG